MDKNELKELLDTEAVRINSVEFIDSDPVQFPRRYEDLRDIEISALLSATIAWGNRKMICRDCGKMLAMLENRPYDFMMARAYEDLPEANIHRTFFVKDLRYYLTGLRGIYERYGTLQEFAHAKKIAKSPTPAWSLVEAMNQELASANPGGNISRCLPQNLNATALKRINMALRWLVRNDGIVDLGVWEVLKPSQLFIPLDVHVVDTARQLGILTRRSPDKKAVMEIMGHLCEFNPSDPVLYDFALFGIGMNL